MDIPSFKLKYSDRKSPGITVTPEMDMPVKAPAGVSMEKLCHLVHHHHTQKFIDLQTREMKDREKWKMKVEKLLTRGYVKKSANKTKPFKTKRDLEKEI